jgi:very-short-patch-repair endonuclease
VVCLRLAVTPACKPGRMNGNDAWSAVAEIAASQHGAFNRSQAAEKTINAQQLRRAVGSGRLRRPLSDVFTFASSQDSHRQRLMVASLAGAVISHRSAASLHGLDGVRSPRYLIEVCFERGNHRDLSALGTVSMHTWSFTSRDDIAVIDGIRVTSIARTLVQLGAVCDIDAVEAALDSALRKGASPRWIESTWKRLRRTGPWGGDGLEAVMYDPSRSGVLSESQLELLVERVISDPALPTPVRQFEVQTSDGPKRLDLAFPTARLGIEGHSKQVHFGPAAEEADNLRDIALAAEGWEILYITWGMAHEPAFFLESLKRTFKQRHQMYRAA